MIFLHLESFENKPPCIMCVQYCGGAQYPGGVQYRGGYHEYRGGGYLQYRGDVQYRGGYHDKCGDILCTVRVFSTVGDIMSTMEVILSTVGMFSTVGDIMMPMGGYHEYGGGCSVPWGIPSFII